MARAHTYQTLIVGAGLTGISAAIKLARAGISDIVILERRTWPPALSPA
ncbi:MAG: FAD-dependent oxidoreductase, partial [Mycobacterium sp.]